ncbi:MAG: histidine phosphatase family protein [Myxococcales bacterium]|nr:histidine phosphatase family protein [Myxococcales bacterium]
MRVLVLRHGQAVDSFEALTDEQRWLTPTGRARVARMADVLVAEGWAPRVIFTSPLVRAVQTAEILAAASPRLERVEVNVALAPERGTTAQALACLDELDKNDTVALVSHEPKVRVLTGHLAQLAHLPIFAPGAATLVDLRVEPPRAVMIEPTNFARFDLRR